MRSLLGPAIVAGAALLGTALPALADPNLPPLYPHRHFIVLPDGPLVEVGPRVCDDPSLQAAFRQFHFNVQAGAAGLHNHRSAEILQVNNC